MIVFDYVEQSNGTKYRECFSRKSLQNIITDKMIKMISINECYMND